MNPSIKPRIIEALAQPWSVNRTLELAGGGEGPLWPNSRAIITTVEVSYEAARRWLPAALEPTEVPMATVFVVEYPECTFMPPYREASVVLHARHRRKNVFFCAWIVVDDDTPMMMGREQIGLPKKLAQIDFELGEDGLGVGVVRRRGIEILRLEAKAATPSQELDYLFPDNTIGVRGFLSVLPGAMWSICLPQEIVRGWKAQTALTIGSSPFDPLEELGVRQSEWPGQVLISHLGVPRERRRFNPIHSLTRFLPTLRPVGFVSHRWMLENLYFRTL